MKKCKLKEGSVIMILTMLVIGTFSMSVTASFAQPSSLNLQEIECGNSNTNVNGIDVNQNSPTERLATEQTGSQENGGEKENGLLGDRVNFEKNLVNICADINLNQQVKSNTNENNNNNDIDQNRQTCEICLTQNLEQEDITELLTELRENSAGKITSFQELCDLLSVAAQNGDQQSRQAIIDILSQSFNDAGFAEKFTPVFECLNQLFNGVFPAASSTA